MSHSITRRAALATAASALAAGTLAACGKKEEAEPDSSDETASGGTVSYAIENPTGIEPYTLEDENAMAVVYQLFDPLTRYNPATQELEPLMAESWDSNEDATEWTFKVRTGTTFHDGTPVTAKSFKTAWDRLVNPASADSASVVSYHLSMVQGYDELANGGADELSGVTCPDDETLVVTLSTPYADFPYIVSTPALGPVPDSALDDYATYAASPVGNGPFMMAEPLVDGQYANLVRYDGYWGDKPAVDGVYFAFYKDSATAFKEVQAGSCDNSVVPANQMSQAEEDYGVADEDGYVSNPGHQVFTGTMMYTQFLVFNVTDPVISDLKVRQALSVAINRQAICDSIYEGSATPATDIVPEAIDGYKEGTWRTSYDPDAAAQLLDEAGYPADADGKRALTIELMTNAANAQEEYEAMIGDWAALGITATINKVEYAAMLDSYLAGTFQVGARGWYADYPIADNYLYPLFYSGSVDNMSHFADETYDALITAARGKVQLDERIAAMQECDNYAASLMPVAPLNYNAISRCSTERVQNLRITPGIQPQLAACSLVQE